MHWYNSLGLLAAFAASVRAQASSEVPSDIASGFRGSTDLQTSFDGDAANGFQNGATFTPEETSEVPEFALGDSSGVNTAASFMIMMVDTTEENNRVLHYLRTDFQPTGEGVGIESQTPPLVRYQGPGSFGEQGERQYCFLLYSQRDGFEGANMPQAGEAFNIQEFQEANNLRDPIAGNVMIVNSQGGGVAAATEEQTPEPTPEPVPEPTPEPVEEQAPEVTLEPTEAPLVEIAPEITPEVSTVMEPAQPEPTYPAQAPADWPQEQVWPPADMPWPPKDMAWPPYQMEWTQAPIEWPSQCQWPPYQMVWQPEPPQYWPGEHTQPWTVYSTWAPEPTIPWVETTLMVIHTPKVEHTPVVHTPPPVHTPAPTYVAPPAPPVAPPVVPPPAPVPSAAPPPAFNTTTPIAPPSPTVSSEPIVTGGASPIEVAAWFPAALAGLAAALVL